jgi:hypothetical protein
VYESPRRFDRRAIPGYGEAKINFHVWFNRFPVNFTLKTLIEYSEHSRSDTQKRAFLQFQRCKQDNSHFPLPGDLSSKNHFAKNLPKVRVGHRSRNPGRSDALPA